MAGAIGIVAGAGVVLALVFAVLWIIERPAAEMRASVAPRTIQSPPPITSTRLSESPALRGDESRLPPAAATTGSAAGTPERTVATDAINPPSAGPVVPVAPAGLQPGSPSIPAPSPRTTGSGGVSRVETPASPPQAQTQASVPEQTQASVPENTQARPNVSEVAEAPRPKATNSRSTRRGERRRDQRYDRRDQRYLLRDPRNVARSNEILDESDRSPGRDRRRARAERLIEGDVAERLTRRDDFGRDFPRRDNFGDFFGSLFGSRGRD